MTSKLFASMGFSVCGLFFMILILIMYLSKKRYSKSENKGFIFLLTFTMLLLILEICYVYSMSISSKFMELLCRTYLIGVLIWLIGYIYYIILLGTSEYEIERKNKIRRRYFLVLLVIALATSIISNMLPLEYNTSINNMYSFSGLATYFVYIVGFTSATVMFILVMLKRFKYPESKKIPIRFAFILIIVLLITQAVTGYDYNISTFLFSFMVATLYFTIESQDSKLLSEVRVLKEEADAANKAKTEFLENMSHEIRTPLNTILGFSETLLAQKRLTKNTVHEDVTNIHVASIALLDLINNILDVSRIESGKEKLVEREYELQDLDFEINSIFTAKIDNKEITFESNVDKNLPRRYYGDYLKICKLIVNILTNALKYTNYGKITLDIGKDNKSKDIEIQKNDFKIDNLVQLNENKKEIINSLKLKQNSDKLNFLKQENEDLKVRNKKLSMSKEKQNLQIKTIQIEKEELNKTNEKLKRSNETQNSQIKTIQKEKEELNKTNENLNEIILEQEKLINEFFSSNSWKLTAPLRKIRNIFK